MGDEADKIKQFCLIQLEILKEREARLRKQILDCNIQKEFLTSILLELDHDD
jgi:hypothetical protein|tara:strand:+ start:1368 stop:1523 length:156 start_codon:yes stop_codon:yes gene_type:complete